MFYTGVGSRNTPNEVLSTMVRYGEILAKAGYTLRSGAAWGADDAFEVGCNLSRGKKEIYIPWSRFNNHLSSLYNVSPNIIQMAKEIYGSRWSSLPESVRLLMSRNMQQVAGLNLDKPSEFLVCWTPDGCESREERTRITGGTGQAIAYADKLGIPIFNLQCSDDEFKEYLENRKVL